MAMDYRYKVNIVDYVPHISEMSEGEKHLRSFIGAASFDELLPPETMKFLIQAFSKILQGKDPKKALELTQKQGQKGAAARAKKINEEITLAIMVEERIIKQGMLPNDARQAVMNDKGLKDLKSVRTPHKKHEGLARIYVLTEGLTDLKAIKGKK